MPTLIKIKPKNERELHSIIEKELDALEEGLALIKYEFFMQKGTPDFLCVDSGGRLVIIEVKLNEDENILFQALRYYNEIDNDRYIIAKVFSGKDINPEEHPRIVLIAENLSDDIRRLSSLVTPDVELFEYTLLKTKEDIEGICFHPVSLPKIKEVPPKPKTIEEIRKYMTKKELFPLFDKIIKEISKISDKIEIYATLDYIGFKYRGRQIAYLWPHRKSFDIGVNLINENNRTIEYDNVRIEIGTEDWTEVLEKIKKSFENIQGKS